MKQILAEPNDAVEPMQDALFDLLLDRSLPQDHLLPDTGMGLKWERILSSLFITSPDYGTRSSTLLLIDHRDRCSVIEKTFEPGVMGTPEAKFEFNIGS
ncbi:MAG: NRDE family protein [Deltaproteobacteria bacterium]|nr:NRDE family protein [Deltaproteobacteria bacterium]